MGYGGKGKSSGGKGKSSRGYFGVRRTIKGNSKGFRKGKGKGFRGNGKGKGKGFRRKGKGKGKASKDSLDRQLEEYMGPDEMKKVLDTELDTYFDKQAENGERPAIEIVEDKKEEAAAPATSNGSS